MMVICEFSRICFNSVNPMMLGQEAPRGTPDEMAYMEKWKQLQKYIEPLKRMINKIDKEEGLFYSCAIEAFIISEFFSEHLEE